MSDEQTILEASAAVTAAGKPFVRLIWGPMRGQFSPEEARRQAVVFLEVAEAAEQDAFLVTLLREKLQMEDRKISQCLKEFRIFREERAAGKRR